MHYLMLCELYNPKIHGKTEESDLNIESHYLVYDTFDPITKLSHSNGNTSDADEYDSVAIVEHLDDNLVTLDDELTFLKKVYSNLSDNYNIGHPSIRNYDKIIARPDYIRVEIGEYIILPSQETVAILKTFWLRIIQRKWRRLYKEKMN